MGSEAEFWHLGDLPHSFIKSSPFGLLTAFGPLAEEGFAP